MRPRQVSTWFLIFGLVTLAGSGLFAQEAVEIALPTPQLKGEVSLEETLAARRTARRFAEQPLSTAELGQLLWAAQGITAAGRLRTAPSAGALYPLEVHVVVGAATGVEAGLYRYDPARHRLALEKSGDLRAAVAEAALGQSWVQTAPVVVVISAVAARTRARYGDRTDRYVAMEVGHAAQNLCLQAVALGLGAGAVGAFRDADLAQVLSSPEDEAPLYVLPVGRPAP